MSRLVVLIYQGIYILHTLHIPLLPVILNIIFVRLLFSCQISMGAKIGKGTKLGLGGLAVAIHKRAVIGNNVVISQGVTIGGRSKHYAVPVIGDNCHIAPGAKVLGPIVVGKNSIIGANAVVIENVPENSVVAGVPAKVIKSNIDIKEYLTI